MDYAVEFMLVEKTLYYVRDLGCNVCNGSGVTVKIKPYTGKYGTFAELIAVKVTDLIEYSEASSDNEEF